MKTYLINLKHVSLHKENTVTYDTTGAFSPPDVIEKLPTTKIW